MSFHITTTEISHLGFAATFLCISLGFIFVKLVLKEENGPGIWAISFFLNSIGFIFWSGKISIAPWQYFLIGEITHMSGFILLVVGIYGFTGHKIKMKSIFTLLAFLSIWILMIVNFKTSKVLSVIGLRVLKTSLFCFGGFCVLLQSNKQKNVGEKLAISSLIIWGLYNLLYGFIRTERFNDYVFGVLVGLHVLTAFGLITMIVNKIYLKAEKSELRINQLEKLLPICAHCRKIKDNKKEWHTLESYIEQKTSSQFSHGICPDCLEKYYPEYAGKIKNRQ